MNREIQKALDRFKKLEYASPEWLHYSVMEDLVAEWNRCLQLALQEVTVNFPLINDVIATMHDWRMLKKDGAPSGVTPAHGGQ